MAGGNLTEPSANLPYAPEGFSGSLYITENSFGSVYATSLSDPNMKYSDIKASGQESISDPFTEDASSDVVSEKVYEPRNI